MTDTKFAYCATCGRKVSLNGQLCARCGADLSEQQVIRSSRGTATTQQVLTAGEWNNKGAALFKLKRHKKALQCFDKALRLPRFRRRYINVKNEYL
jgi:predicted amidophosphoribosyltransferase